MYLEQRAAEDALFAKNYRNPAKNIDDCVTYILNYVQRSGCCLLYTSHKESQHHVPVHLQIGERRFAVGVERFGIVLFEEVVREVDVYKRQTIGIATREACIVVNELA